MRCLGDRVGYPQIAPEFALLAISVDHGISAYAIVCRLDRRKSEVAQSALVVDKIVERDRRAGADRSLLANPGVDIVGDDGLFQPAEIANARAAGKKHNNEDG